MESANFQFGQTVKITASGQTGILVGYNCYVNSEPSWQVRYKNAAGNALEAAPSGTG